MKSFDLHDLDDTVVVHVEEFSADEATDEWQPSIVKPGISEEYAERIAAAAFEPARHLNHARLCPSCSSLLQACDTGWACLCGLTMTRDEMAALMGAPSADGAGR